MCAEFRGTGCRGLGSVTAWPSSWFPLVLMWTVPSRLAWSTAVIQSTLTARCPSFPQKLVCAPACLHQKEERKGMKSKSNSQRFGCCAKLHRKSPVRRCCLNDCSVQGGLEGDFFDPGTVLEETEMFLASRSSCVSGNPCNSCYFESSLSKWAEYCVEPFSHFLEPTPISWRTSRPKQGLQASFGPPADGALWTIFLPGAWFDVPFLW